MASNRISPSYIVQRLFDYQRIEAVGSGVSAETDEESQAETPIRVVKRPRFERGASSELEEHEASEGPKEKSKRGKGGKGSAKGGRGGRKGGKGGKGGKGAQKRTLIVDSPEGSEEEHNMEIEVEIEEPVAEETSSLKRKKSRVDPFTEEPEVYDPFKPKQVPTKKLPAFRAFYDIRRKIRDDSRHCTLARMKARLPGVLNDLMMDSKKRETVLIPGLNDLFGDSESLDHLRANTELYFGEHLTMRSGDRPHMFTEILDQLGDGFENVKLHDDFVRFLFHIFVPTS